MPAGSGCLGCIPFLWSGGSASASPSIKEGGAAVAVDAAFDGARGVDTRFDQGQHTRLNRTPTVRLQTVPTKMGCTPLPVVLGDGARAVAAMSAETMQDGRPQALLKLDRDAVLAVAVRRASTLKARACDGTWPGETAKAARKGADERWMIKSSKAKACTNGTKQVDTAIPVFSYKSRICANRRNRIIRRQMVPTAAVHDGAKLREGLIEACGMASRIRHRKLRRHPMSEQTIKANMRKSAVRAKVGHIVAGLKSRMGLKIRTIGMALVAAANTLVNMAAIRTGSDRSAAGLRLEPAAAGTGKEPALPTLRTGPNRGKAGVDAQIRPLESASPRGSGKEAYD